LGAEPHRADRRPSPRRRHRRHRAADRRAPVAVARADLRGGQPRPAPAATSGTDIVAKADPGWHTLLLATIGTASINQFLYPRLPYDPLRDFASVALINQVTNAIVVHPGVAANNLGELLALARQSPGTMNYGTPGNGTSGHMCAEYLKFRTQTRIGHVPYRGTGALMPDLLGGRIEMAVDNLPAYLPHIREGRLRIPRRHQPRPLVRRARGADSGSIRRRRLRGGGLVRHAGPRPHAAPHPRPADLRRGGGRGRAGHAGALPRPRRRALLPRRPGFDRFIAAENDKWREVVRVAGIRLDVTRL
jgi:hypothetical protein